MTLTANIEVFDRLVHDVMTQEPYTSAKRVFGIVDNGSSHRGQTSFDRLHSKWPQLVLVHLPVHASWLNQIKIYFSILQRKALTPNDFPSLESLAQTILEFQGRYQRTATPWEYLKLKWRSSEENTSGSKSRPWFGDKHRNPSRAAIPRQGRIAALPSTLPPDLEGGKVVFDSLFVIDPSGRGNATLPELVEGSLFVAPSESQCSITTSA